MKVKEIPKSRPVVTLVGVNTDAFISFVRNATYMENISYGELAEIQQFAKASIEYWEERRGYAPANPDEAEMAVRCAYGECWIDTDEPWKYIEERLELILNQIGLMVENEQ